jgi:glycyl-tRNA synthetase
MSKAFTFQEVILRLQRYWAEYGCTIWQPYSEKLGAGTMNPATTLRVLGPEPWNVAYVEPSYRPDDGRYGQNPNRMQMHYQFQVILKPEPGNPQELYLESLEALGVDRLQHDLRFVEDNWESRVLGDWGLGWEVWLDGQEISQYTYFQQAGGYSLDPVSVELTYGLERIVMTLQRVHSVWEIDWDGTHTYGDILLRPEVEHCTYDFQVADVERLTEMYDLFEAEAQACIAKGLVIPAHDYVLRCSHTFNLLDSRGAVGVTERAQYFARMRNLSRQVAEAYIHLRQELGYPLLKAEAPQQVGDSNAADLAEAANSAGAAKTHVVEGPALLASELSDSADLSEVAAPAEVPETFVLEIGTEELPHGDLTHALRQLEEGVRQWLEDLHLAHGRVQVEGTPRRLAVVVDEVAPHQPDREQLIKGPPASRAYDMEGNPTRAAEGFARSKGVAVTDLQVREMEGGQYVVAIVHEAGRPAGEVLCEALPGLLASIAFEKSMRWNASGVAFARPIRWLVALLGKTVLPFTYAAVQSGRTTRGLRLLHSPSIEIAEASAYWQVMDDHGVVVKVASRREMIRAQVEALAAEVEGVIPDDPLLLDEVTNLVESPTALRGRFEEEYLKLPTDILISVMTKHQRYFPVVGSPGSERAGELLPYFITVRNGDDRNLPIVRLGNEDVIRARFADASFFYENDTRRHLGDFIPLLAKLTFQEKLGSMLDKVKRLERLAPRLGEMLNLCPATLMTIRRVAELCKADLTTQMVIEMTRLQGIMGREYARLSGEPDEIANAIFEHYLPRFGGDALPTSQAGIIVGLADRLDSLVGLFAIGLKPSGTKDPFALRRAALGIVQVLVGTRLHLDLRMAIQLTAEMLPVPCVGATGRSPALSDEAMRPQQVGDSNAASPQSEVLDYIAQRLRGLLLEDGLRYDVVDAVLAERKHDPYLAAESASVLNRWVQREDWMDLLHAYSRCVRIVRSEETRHPVDPERFTAKASSDLYDALRVSRATISEQRTMGEVLRAIQKLVPTIHAFFDCVLVMHEDAAVRENRLGLVQSVAELTEGVADFTKLEGF